MGHDIFGYNKAGEEIAYARFSMGNHNALILYRLLNAYEYYAGVSGSGRGTTISKEQIEEALKVFEQQYNNKDSAHTNYDFLRWDGKQINDFIKNCSTTAKKEGNVKVFFG